MAEHNDEDVHGAPGQLADRAHMIKEWQKIPIPKTALSHDK